MKFFWPILLICLVLGNTKADEKDLNKLVKVVKFLKVIGDIKEGKRKLQQSTDDTTDGDTTDDSQISLNSSKTGIDPSKLDDDMGYQTGNSSANYQIKKFYLFSQKKGDDYFLFHMLWAFLQRRVPSSIKMRLLVLYATSRLRNLEDAAQSVPCECTISDSSQSTATTGKNGTGDDIDYSCKGEKDENRMVSRVKVDTSIPMDMDGETVDFKEVNFDEEAAKQAENITNYTEGLSEESSPVYRKSSSGLSGGAIAGIVIACVAVLIAAAVAAIMLRKPTPPIDNTTVVDLKQENI
jgi:hypothetical protein